MKDDRLDVRYRTEPELREQFPTLSEDDQCEFFINLCAAVGAKDRDTLFLYEMAQHLTPAQQKQCRQINADSYDGDKHVTPGTVGSLMYNAQQRIVAAMDTAFNWKYIDPFLREWGLYDLGFSYRFNRKTRYLASLVNKLDGVTLEIMFFMSRGKVKRVLKSEVVRYAATTIHERIVYSKGELHMALAEYGLVNAIPLAREYKIDSLS